MSESIFISLQNARRISQCVPEILQSGTPARCATCTVTRCRSQLNALATKPACNGSR